MAHSKLAIDLPLATPRTSALLIDAMEELALPASANGDTPSDAWMNGVSWSPNPCRPPLFEDVDDCEPTSAAPSTTPNYPACLEAVTQEAFRVYDVLQSARLELSPEQLVERLEGRYRNWRSWAMARELSTGAGSGGMSLASEATAPVGLAFGSAATPIWNAVAVLETELARRMQNGQGVIHLTPGLLAQFVKNYGVERDGPRYRTPLGNLVVADGGSYLPPPPTGEAASGVAEDWIYASGPVFYRESGPMLLDHTDITRNQVEAWLSSYGLLAFDPCPVTAVLASYDLT